MICYSPAKINLFLHIIGQRQDGYHLLQSIMQFVDFCDELTITTRDTVDISIEPDLLNVPTSQNLIYKAAFLLQQTCHVKQGCHIIINKKIPLGAGLGGGSSNAATTLVALNQLWQCGLTSSQLETLGVQLGADVPIFIRGQTCWVEGIGECLTPIEITEKYFLILIPSVSVSSREIYSAKELTRDAPALKIRALPNERRNVFEPVVFNRFPKVAEVFNWLNQFIPARMSGTGAAIYAWSEDNNLLASIASQVAEPWQIILAKGVNKSPLYLPIA